MEPYSLSLTKKKYMESSTTETFFEAVDFINLDEFSYEELDAFYFEDNF